MTVAVADTGVDLGHPELAGRLVPGYDFVDDDADPQDAHGHGTHVAGTIAAGANGAGVVGVAPDARIMPLRVLDANGGGNSADVAAAFAYAGDRGVRVVNASLGSPYPSQVERAAIRSHPGTLYVVAAGNGGADGVGDDDDDATREYPCAHDEPNLVCVGATDGGRHARRRSPTTAPRASTSPRRARTSSPRTCAGTPVLGQYFGTGDGYEIMEGTSMASPHVAGAAALAASVQPGWAGAQLRSVLLDGADRLPALAGASLTGGRLNAAAAVRIAAGLPAAPGGPEPGPLGPEVLAPGERLTAQPAGRPRRRSRGCASAAGRGCARAAAAARRARPRSPSSSRPRADVGRACSTPALRARPLRLAHARGSVKHHAPQGRTRWRVGRRLLGMRLRRGTWRLTLATSAGSAPARLPRPLAGSRRSGSRRQRRSGRRAARLPGAGRGQLLAARRQLADHGGRERADHGGAGGATVGLDRAPGALRVAGEGAGCGCENRAHRCLLVPEGRLGCSPHSRGVLVI